MQSNVIKLRAAIEALRTDALDKPGDMDLGDLNIRAGGACRLAVQLQRCRSCTCLNLADNEVMDDGVVALARSLHKNIALTSLTLRATRMSDIGAEALAQMLRVNSTLCSINLRDNEITDRGAGALMAALKPECNSTMKQLDLRKNFVCDSDVLQTIERRLALNRLGAITTALRINSSSLTDLDLRGDTLPQDARLADEGTCALCDALLQNSRLTSLQLWSNDVGDAGGIAVAELIRRVGSTRARNCGRNSSVLRSLTSIGLQDNQLGDIAAAAFAVALASRSRQHPRALGAAAAARRAAATARGTDNNAAHSDTESDDDPPLLELRLWQNNITSEGACALADALTHHPVQLIAGCEDETSEIVCEDDGAIESYKNGATRASLARRITQANGTLCTLDLRSNRIGQRGALALLAALASSCSLRSLCLGSNLDTPLGDEVLHNIAVQLARSRCTMFERLQSNDATMQQVVLRTSYTHMLQQLLRGGASVTPLAHRTACRASHVRVQPALDALCLALSKNRVLSSLDVCLGTYGRERRDSFKGDQFAFSLAAVFDPPQGGFGCCDGLQRLRLSSCDIGWRGVDVLVNALRSQRCRLLDSSESFADMIHSDRDNTTESSFPALPARVRVQQGNVCDHQVVGADEREWRQGLAIAMLDDDCVQVVYEDLQEENVASTSGRIQWLDPNISVRDEKHDGQGAPSSDNLLPTGCNIGLRALLLPHNCIGDSGARALLDLLRGVGDLDTGVESGTRAYQSLTMLDVRDNGIEAGLEQQLYETVAANRLQPLFKIIRAGHVVTPEDAAALDRCLRISGAQVSKLQPHIPRREISRALSLWKTAEDGYEHLCPCTAFHTLYLAHNDIGDLLCSSIADAILAGANVDVPELKAENELELTFNNIDLSYNHVGDIGAIALANCCGKLGQAKRPSLTHVEHIILDGNVAIGDDAARAWQLAAENNPALVTISFVGCTISDECRQRALESFACNRLRGVLDRVKIDDRLRKLRLRGESVGDQFAIMLAKALRPNKSLTLLDVSNNIGLGDDGLHALAAALDHDKTTDKSRPNTTLMSVNTSHTGASEPVQTLLRERCVANELKGIVVALRRGEGDGPIAGAGPKDCFAAGHLALRNRCVGAELGMRLSASLRTNTAITVLDLRDNNLTDDGAAALARAALRAPKPKRRSRLEHVGERQQSSDDEEYEPLAGAWLSLTSLNLRNNAVGDEGAAALARALRTTPRAQLKRLNLRSNKLSDAACTKLAKALAKSRSLDFDEQDGHGHVIAMDDQHHCALQVLNLRDNPGVTDIGAKALGKALSKNETLTQLKMRGCGGITQEAQGFIAEGLCVTLKELIEWW